MSWSSLAASAASNTATRTLSSFNVHVELALEIFFFFDRFFRRSSVPASICVDRCRTKRNYPPSRSEIIQIPVAAPSQSGPCPSVLSGALDETPPQNNPTPSPYYNTLRVRYRVSLSSRLASGTPSAAAVAQAVATTVLRSLQARLVAMWRHGEGKPTNYVSPLFLPGSSSTCDSSSSTI